MFDQIMLIIISCLNAVWGFFEQVFNALGSWTLYLSVLVVFLIARFLLFPLLGGSAGQSDKVKKSTKDVK